MFASVAVMAVEMNS